jgi:hypothetical protein
MLYRHRRGYQPALTFSELCKLTSDGRQKSGAGQRRFDAGLEFDAERNRQNARGFAPALANAG